MSEEKYKSPSLTTDAIVLRKHKNDSLHDILLVTRGHDPFKDHLAFPGGFVEYGEEPGKGCLRELKEETNLDGKNLELLTIRGEPNRDPRKHVVTIVYDSGIKYISKLFNEDNNNNNIQDIKDIKL